MRYYELKLTPSNAETPADQVRRLKTGVTSSASGKSGETKIWSSLYADGTNNLNALQIEIDVPIVQLATPQGQAYIRIYGVELTDIMQATNYNGALVELSLGMSPGLPLVKPEQRGVVLVGRVFQAFGNWQGEQQTLDLIVMAADTSSGNYTFSWKAGTKMADMITQVLKRNHPGIQVKTKISDNLILSADETGVYFSLIQFAQYVNDVSRHINTDPAYSGVHISITEQTFIVSDGSTKSKPKDIAFNDLIGQPQWMNMSEVQFKTVMRADIHIDDYVNLPIAMTTRTAASRQDLKKDNLAFSGVFHIVSVRHVGSSRQAGADSWVTVFNGLMT